MFSPSASADDRLGSEPLDFDHRPAPVEPGIE
jgi:hypothetical protein